METQFDVLVNDTKIAKKYEIFSTKIGKKNLKNGFFDKIVHFDRNTG